MTVSRNFGDSGHDEDVVCWLLRVSPKTHVCVPEYPRAHCEAHVTLEQRCHWTSSFVPAPSLTDDDRIRGCYEALAEGN